MVLNLEKNLHSECRSRAPNHNTYASIILTRTFSKWMPFLVDNHKVHGSFQNKDPQNCLSSSQSPLLLPSRPPGGVLLLERQQAAAAQVGRRGRERGRRADRRALHARRRHEPDDEPGAVGPVPQQVPRRQATAARRAGRAAHPPGGGRKGERLIHPDDMRRAVHQYIS